MGKIVNRIPYLGGISYYMQSEEGPNVLIICAVIIFLAIIFSVLKSKRKKEIVESENGLTVGENEEKRFLDFLKRSFRKIRKHKHFVIPRIVLFIIIIISIIDTVDA